MMVNAEVSADVSNKINHTSVPGVQMQLSHCLLALLKEVLLLKAWSPAS